MAKKTLVPSEIKAEIVDAAGLMLSIGADWPTIRTELFRQTTGQDFKKWRAEHLPSQSTLERWLKSDAGVTSLVELKEKRLMTIRTRLQSKAITMALAGDKALLIFSLKNLCNWSDRHAIEESSTQKFEENTELLKAVPRAALLQLSKKEDNKNGQQTRE